MNQQILTPSARELLTTLPMRVPSVATPPVTTTQPTSTTRTAVPLQRTVASPSAIRGALTRAVQQVTGQAPRPSLVAVLNAQVSLETGGGRSMFNYNFGGIKGTGPSGLTATAPTHEVSNGATVATRAGFRAYTSIDEGARDYVSLIARRYPEAFQAAAGGDVDGFAHALHQGGYYTATEVSYANGLRGALGMPQRADSGSDPATGAPTNAVASLAVGADASGFSSSETLGRLMDALSASALQIARPADDKDA